MKRIGNIRKAMTEFARKQIVFRTFYKKLGDRIIDEFAEYLGDVSIVHYVPPKGDWNPDKDYGSGICDYNKYGAYLIGISVKIDNENDDGCSYVRFCLICRKKAEGLEITIGEGKTIILSDENLNSLYELMYKSILDSLKNSIEQFVTVTNGPSNKIGFMADI